MKTELYNELEALNDAAFDEAQSQLGEITDDNQDEVLELQEELVCDAFIDYFQSGVKGNEVLELALEDEVYRTRIIELTKGLDLVEELFEGYGLTKDEKKLFPEY